MIYNIGLALHRVDDALSMLHSLLIEIGFREDHTVSSAAAFLTLCRFFVLFRDPNAEGGILDHLIGDPPFGRSDSPTPRPADILARILARDILPAHNIVGLRSATFGTWEDVDLAIIAMRIFSTFPARPFVATHLLLDAYVARIDRPLVAALLPRREDVQAHLPLVQLLNHHARLEEAQQFLVQSSPQATEEGAFAALHDSSSTPETARMCPSALAALQEFLRATASFAISAFDSGDDSFGELDNLLLRAAEGRHASEHRSARVWLRLWRSLVIERSPWSGTATGEAR
jgi:hypothetical protein